MSLSIDTAAPRGGEQGIASLSEIVFLALLPGLAFWLMNFQPVMQNGFLDPFIYTGYINNFTDLFQRYGATYYGVRFGTIVPGQIAAALFGPIPGYFVLRYALALVAGVPFYLLVRQQYGRPIAFASVCLLVTSPFLARTLLWDYPDSTGVPFLLAAICLLSIEHPRRAALDVAAGICAAMAVNSNVFTLMPLGMYFGVYTLLWLAWKRDARTIAQRLGIIAVAAIAVTAAGAAYYWVRVGRANIFAITFEMSTSLLGGTMADWRTAGTEWMTRLWWVLAPLYLVVLAPLVWSWRRVSFNDAVFWVSSAGVVAFYYVYQFALNGTFLQLFYYFSYSLPFVFLLLTLTMTGLWAGETRPRQWIHAGIVLAAAIVPWVLASFGRSPLHDSTFQRHLAVAGVGAVLLVVAAWLRRPATSWVATAALGFMFVSCFAGPGGAGSVYSSAVASRLAPSSKEGDVYRVALQFIQSVPRWRERPGMIRFWYSNLPPSNAMQSIQSTYLWGFSKVQGETGPGLPTLEPAELERIRGHRVEWLALLAEKEDQLALARSTLLEHDVRFTRVDRRVLTSGSYALHFELLDLEKDQ